MPSRSRRLRAAWSWPPWVYDPVAPDYDYLDGTSMATPFVSGAAALAWSARPQLGLGAVKNLIASTARDLGAEGPDRLTGHGRLDADKMLRSLR